MDQSPTALALLGLMAVRPWTTYELANQAKRSLQYFLPRAERHVYTEAKRLADAGLAKAEVTFTGKRRSTRYSITPSGRKVLREWLQTTPVPPVLEIDVLVHSFFADSGRKEDLLSALEAARHQARVTQAELAEMARQRLDGEAPFPQRTAVGALSMRFVADFHRLLEQWATWAAGEVATWERADGQDWERALEVMGDLARLPVAVNQS